MMVSQKISDILKIFSIGSCLLSGEHDGAHIITPDSSYSSLYSFVQHVADLHMIIHLE